ncbi:Efflux pump ustT-like protein [Cladobotryum mycophilum]|uniref:Efflux pump ustT-like protein n=1 Tax=Cladobotryum mycophilum TaxID=491253 RepID=A0ABR0SPC2_9HYPO
MVDIELDASEDVPFLDEGERQDDDPIGAKFTSSSSPPRPTLRASRWQAKSPRTIVLLVSLLKFFIVVTAEILFLPLFRLIEDTVCHVYYNDDSLDVIDEMKCKVDGVQSDLAYMMGWLGIFHSVLSLLVTFPFGTLADKIGRKPTALFSYAGIALSLFFGPFMLGTMQREVRSNPYILVLGSLFLFLGGGIQVLLAALYSIAADVSSEKEKASSFVYLTFGAAAGGLIGPLIAGALMQKFGPWVPIYLVLIATPFNFLLFFFIPETLVIDVKVKRQSETVVDALKEHVAKGLHELKESFGMLKNPNIPLILIYYLFQNARLTAYGNIIVQYLSKNFGWKLAETSFLLSPLGVFNLMVLAALPKISEILMSRRFGYSSFQKDLVLTKMSTIVFIIGAVIEGMSSNIVMFILGIFIQIFGTANSPLARATVTHYIEPEFTSRLYALIGMVDIVGSVFGGPVLAWCFSTGLEKKGAWMGLPWYYIAFLGSLTWLGLVFVRPPPAKDTNKDVDGNGAEEYPLGDVLHQD